MDVYSVCLPVEDLFRHQLADCGPQLEAVAAEARAYVKAFYEFHLPQNRIPVRRHVVQARICVHKQRSVETRKALEEESKGGKERGSEEEEVVSKANLKKEL